MLTKSRNRSSFVYPDGCNWCVILHLAWRLMGKKMDDIRSGASWSNWRHSHGHVVQLRAVHCVSIGSRTWCTLPSTDLLQGKITDYALTHTGWRDHRHNVCMAGRTFQTAQSRIARLCIRDLWWNWPNACLVDHIWNTLAV